MNRTKKPRNIDGHEIYNFVKADWKKISFQLFILIAGIVPVSSDSTRGYQVTQEITTLEPNIVLQTSAYEGDRENISGIWLTSDFQPILDAQITMVLFQNDTGVEKIKEILLTSLNGSFNLEFDYSDFLPGNYFWDIKFRKSGYQGWDFIENVMIIPHTFKIRLDASPELVRGREFNIAAIVTYTSVNSDRFGQPAPDIELKFKIKILYVDDSQEVIFILAITNLNGVVVVSLTPEKTKSVLAIESITAEIQQQNKTYSAELETENLPLIVDKDDSFIERTVELLENNTILLAFLTLFFASSTIILLVTRNKIPLKQKMWPKNEK